MYSQIYKLCHIKSRGGYAFWIPQCWEKKNVCFVSEFMQLMIIHVTHGLDFSFHEKVWNIFFSCKFYEKFMLFDVSELCKSRGPLRPHSTTYSCLYSVCLGV